MSRLISVRQANFLLPENVLTELRNTVPKGEQSKVVSEAIAKELKSIRLTRCLEESFGTWKDADHPELVHGTQPYIRRLRTSNRQKRLKRIGGVYRGRTRNEQNNR